MCKNVYHNNIFRKGLKSVKIQTSRKLLNKNYGKVEKKQKEERNQNNKRRKEKVNTYILGKKK